MCEISTVLIGVAAAGIIAAIASIGVAIVLNNGFFTAPAAPAAMIAAGVSSLVAMGALSMLSSNISDYFLCMGALSACNGELSNVINAINALIAVLGIQATASFVAAGVAWIPWAGAAPMYFIMASLIVQAALIPSLYVFIADLVSCMNEHADDPIVIGVVGVAVAVAVAATGLTAYVRRDQPWKWKV